ncbi:unnamed protein product [Vicia faba]|uniref:Uncharacterized protein n=1 Tax=Vicia faba TaxID=3906 RepID=A0AAV1AHJ8_VICFA|nr:unnamed protein product [Vicia faba]
MTYKRLNISSKTQLRNVYGSARKGQHYVEPDFKANVMLGHILPKGPKSVRKSQKRKLMDKGSDSVDEIQNSPPSSLDSLICFESTGDSYIVQGNKRILGLEDGDVKGKVWDVASQLGIEGKDSYEVYMEAIWDMEARDNTGNLERQENSINVEP